MSVSQHPTDPWLPAWFQPPARAELTTGHHLRPLRPADAGLPGTSGLLVGLYPDAAATTSVSSSVPVCYGVFDDEEQAVLGVLRLDRGIAPHDVEARWTVVALRTGSELPDALDEALPAWLVGSWPFTAPRVVGRVVS